MKHFEGKIVLVTGAASGIGRATARQFAREGAKLILCDIDGEGLESLRAELGEAVCVSSETVDVGDREAMRRFSDRVHEVVPAVDVLVNNAGVGLAGGLLDMTLEDWDWVLGVNLWGVIYGCHFFVPAMAERGQGGHVVNISSAAGFFGVPELLAYGTAKFGVLGMSESLRGDLGRRGIGVTAVCPGLIHTGIVDTTRFRGEQQGARERAKALFRKRNYSPDKVAKALVEGVRRNEGVVPVTPEAWALYYLKRFVPSAGPAMARVMGPRALR